MEAHITTKPAFRVVGLKHRGNNDNNELPQLWDRFAERVAEVKPSAVEPITAYGICTNLDKQNNIFDYIAGLEVHRADRIPPGMVLFEIPEQEYAVFECTLPTIIVTIDLIYHTWLPGADYERTDGPEFELYDADFDPTVPESTLQICIPIREK